MPKALPSPNSAQKARTIPRGSPVVYVGPQTSINNLPHEKINLPTQTCWTYSIGVHQEVLQNLHALHRYLASRLFQLQEFLQPKTVLCILL